MFAKTFAKIAIPCLALSACNPKFVDVPPPGADEVPVITVSHVASGNSGMIDEPEVSSIGGPAAQVNVSPSERTCEIPKIVVTAGAKNMAGGVKDLSVVISRDAESAPLYSVSASSNPNSDGQVPVSLGIVGHDGAGSIGGEPLLIVFDGGKLGCPTSDRYTIATAARNFNNQVANFNVILSADLSSEGCLCE